MPLRKSRVAISVTQAAGLENKKSRHSFFSQVVHHTQPRKNGKDERQSGKTSEVFFKTPRFTNLAFYF